MSTIVARVNLDGRPVDAGALRQMLEVQNHRGPGRKDVWTKANVGLGHGLNPLADHTAYPLVSDDGNLVLVADARIDNREDLERALGIAAPPDQDGPLILAAYRKWGADCTRHLRGDFAFVLWDATEQRLVGARDPFGTRSLFYHHAPSKHLIVSSEIKGLWCHPEPQKKIDEVRLAETLQLIDTDATRTMFEGVRGVPAAHGFVATAQSLRMLPYWQPDSSGEIVMKDDEAYAEAFREHFGRAVRRRMRGAKKPAAELSGGLDSSSVACVARDVQREADAAPLDTISLRYPGDAHTDEGEYIQAVLDTGHFAPHEVIGSARSSLSDLDAVFKVMDDPSLVAGNHHHVWMRFELASSFGADVVLTGYDGDTTVGHGFDRYYEFIRRGEWSTFHDNAEAYERHMYEGGSGPGDQVFMAARGVVLSYGAGALERAANHRALGDFRRILAGLHKSYGFSRKKYLRLYGPHFLVPAWVAERQRRANLDVSPLLRADLVKRTALRDRVAQAERPREWPVDARALQADVLHGPNYLRTVEALDSYAAAFSLEGRYPFLDRDLVDFCLRLPIDQSFRDGWSRGVMRRGMKGILPEKVRRRPGKTSFAKSSDESIVNVDAEKLRSVMDAPGLLAEYVDVANVRAVVAKPIEEWDKDAIRIAQMASLREWIAVHF